MAGTFKEIARNSYSPFQKCLMIHFYLAKLPVSMDDIVQKEALYCAVGRCARRLKGVVEFESALETIFTVETDQTNPKYVFLSISQSS